MTEPLILWFRRDLRLADHPMLAAAMDSKRPLIPVFILDPETESIGAAAKWRWGLSVEDFARRLEAMGSRLILRRGPALEVLESLIEETGAAGVMWSRLYDPDSMARDKAVKAALKARNLIADSHPGHLLFEPWTVETTEGDYFKVYTPFWNAVRGRDIGAPLKPPSRLPAPQHWPKSDRLADWHLARPMQRGAKIVAPYQKVGEEAAQDRLRDFLHGRLARYSDARDLLAVDGTSHLSENLTYGEIGIRTVWHAAWHAMEQGGRGAERFLKELVWRDFAWHLIYHTPRITTRNWREDWDDFPWKGDGKAAEAWRRGLTGEPVVDAAMREMYVTGRMHNRARMIVASYLCKHLLTHWKVGLDWFADCLTDWDPASNALGWQWTAGSGPDAAPYFRVFNPALQAEKFDPKGRYRHRYLAEIADDPDEIALSYFDAVPKSWHLDPKAPYPKPLVSLAEGRQRALAAYAARKA